MAHYGSRRGARPVSGSEFPLASPRKVALLPPNPGISAMARVDVVKKPVPYRLTTFAQLVTLLHGRGHPIELNTTNI